MMITQKNQNQKQFLAGKPFPAASLLAVIAAVLALLLQWGIPTSSHAAPKLPEGAKVVSDLAYVAGGHARQKLDLYLPASPKGPLLVYIHGGGWVGGDKSQVAPGEFLARGYSVASLNYRFSNHAIFPAQIQDCKAAVRWLRSHAGEYGYDPKRIAAWGESAGGHLTALLATTGASREFDAGENLEQSSAIQCGIDIFGPTDLPGFQPPNENPAVQRTGKESLLTRLLGGTVEEKPELARKASPLAWASKDSAPLFILHGTRDALVKAEQSERLAEKYKSLGVEVTLDIIEGAGHGGPEFLAGDRPQRLLDFLERHLKR